MKKQVAEILLETGAVKLSPNELFTFSSGIKSPIYCDNRELLAYPAEREMIIQSFMTIVHEHLFDIIAGTATAGIPWASFVADRMGKPMAYVRSSAKAHGRNKQIEGANVATKHVALFEDLISTGGSVATAYRAILEEAKSVTVFAIFTYSLSVTHSVLKGIEYQTLCDFETLIDVAQEQGYISEADIPLLTKWQRNPKEFD